MPARLRGIEPLHKRPCPTLIQHSPGRKPVTPPSSEEGVRVSPLVGAELGISVPAKEGPNAPPPQRVTRRSQAPKFASKLKEVGHRGRGGLPAGQATHAVPKTAWRRL